MNMSNVIPLRPNAEATEPLHPLAERYGVTLDQLHRALSPLMQLMHTHGIPDIKVEKEGNHAVITIDGKAL
jgi:hypothetical protein